MSNLPLDLGYIIDGVVERDPMTERLRIYTVDAKGSPVVIYMDDLLERYEGREIKLTLASMETIRAIEENLGDGPGVMGLMPEDVPGATYRKTSKPQ